MDLSPSITKIMVAGGAKSFVEGTLQDNFSRHGVTIVAHVGDRDRKSKVPVAIPKEVEGVVILTDTCSHALFNGVKELSAKAGVPVACVSRHFAKAEPSLRALGFLPPAPKGSQSPPVEDMEELAMAYITEELGKGRLPKRAEVESLLRRAFGSEAALSAESWGQVYDKAKASPDWQPQKQVHDWAVTVLENHPEKILDLKSLADHVVQISETSLDPSEVAKVISDTVEEVKERFDSKKKEDREWRTKIQDEWIREQFRRAPEGTSPSQGELNEASRKIFTVVTYWTTRVRPLRAEVMGEWTRDLIKSGKAYDHYCSVVGDGDRLSYQEFKKLVDTGVIKSLRSGTDPKKGKAVVYTSTLAVDEYLESLRATPSEPETKVEPDPEPEVETSIEAAGGSVEVEVKPKGSDKTPIVVEVALEVASIVEGVVTTKINEVLEPLLAEIQQVRTEVQNALAFQIQQTNQVVKPLLSEVQLIRAETDGLRASMQEVLEVKPVLTTVSRKMEVLASLAAQISASSDRLTELGQVIEDLGAEMAMESNRAFQMRNQVTELGNQVTELVQAVKDLDQGAPSSDAMDLQKLVALANSAGMRLTIEAGPRKDS